MPRPASTLSQLHPLVDEFARRLGATLERFITARIEKELKVRPAPGGRSRVARRRRAKVLCYYPGCKNVAAPRFGMFCAALHKDLPKAEKERLRAERAKELAAAEGHGDGAAQVTAGKAARKKPARAGGKRRTAKAARGKGKRAAKAEESAG